MNTRNAMLALAALPLSACSPVSLSYTDMTVSPTLRDALWVIQTVTLPDALGGGQSTVESFWVTDVRNACEDLQTFNQDVIDLAYSDAYDDLKDQDTCDTYRADLESVLDSRPDTTWELTIGMSVGGEIEDGSKELGGVGGFDLNLLHYTGDLTQSYLDAVGDDCQNTDEEEDLDDLRTLYVAHEGEAEFTENGTDAWDVTLTRIELREFLDDDDEGMIDGEFSADLCEIDLVYPVAAGE